MSAAAGGLGLFFTGTIGAQKAFVPGTLRAAEGQAAQGRWSTDATCLALTWLNLNVCLGTVVRPDRWPRPGPASLVLSRVLGYRARALAPLVARPSTCRVRDILVDQIGWTIVGTLVLA